MFITKGKDTSSATESGNSVEMSHKKPKIEIRLTYKIK